MWTTLVYRRNEDHGRAVAALATIHGAGSVAYRDAQHFDGCEPTGQVLVLDDPRRPDEVKCIIDAYASMRDENKNPAPIAAEVLKFKVASHAPAPKPVEVVEVVPPAEVGPPPDEDEEPDSAQAALGEIVAPAKVVQLRQSGFGSRESFRAASIGDLIKVPGIGRSTAQKLKAWAED